MSWNSWSRSAIGLWLKSIITGDAEPWSAVLSRRDDVTLGNPFGPFVRGFDDVMATAQGAAERCREGVITGFDRIASHETPGLACVVEVERFEAKVGGSPEASIHGLGQGMAAAPSRCDGLDVRPRIPS